MVKKITMTNQCSTEECWTLDSIHRLTKFKMLVSHSVSAICLEYLLNVKSCPQSVIRNMSTACWGCCQNQQHFWIFNFHRWDGNLCHGYIENFLTNHLVKEFWKIGPHLPKLLSNIKQLTFFGTRCSMLHHERCTCCCVNGCVLGKLTAEPNSLQI